MKSAAVIFAASAALVSAQGPTFNQTTGKYTCPKPNVAYCAGDSLKTDIIIRCNADGVGQPGRCTDNLAGEPPMGLKTALCYQTDANVGDAACEKNCIVYGGSGNGNGTFTLPTSLCKPTYTATSTSTPTGTLYPTTSVSIPTGTLYPTTSVSTPIGTLTTSYSHPIGSTSDCPPPISTGSGSGGSGGSGGNGTYSTSKQSPTPTKSNNPTQVPTAGAVANRVGGALAAIGLVAAYLI